MNILFYRDSNLTKIYFKINRSRTFQIYYKLGLQLLRQLEKLILPDNEFLLTLVLK